MALSNACYSLFMSVLSHHNSLQGQSDSSTSSAETEGWNKRIFYLFFLKEWGQHNTQCMSIFLKASGITADIIACLSGKWNRKGTYILNINPFLLLQSIRNISLHTRELTAAPNVQPTIIPPVSATYWFLFLLFVHRGSHNPCMCRAIYSSQRAGKQSCDKVLCWLLSANLKGSALFFLDATSNLCNWNRLKRSNAPNTLIPVESKIASMQKLRQWKENTI